MDHRCGICTMPFQPQHMDCVFTCRHFCHRDCLKSSHRKQTEKEVKNTAEIEKLKKDLESNVRQSLQCMMRATEANTRLQQVEEKNRVLKQRYLTLEHELRTLQSYTKNLEQENLKQQNYIKGLTESKKSKERVLEEKISIFQKEILSLKKRLLELKTISTELLTENSVNPSTDERKPKSEKVKVVKIKEGKIPAPRAPLRPLDSKKEEPLQKQRRVYNLRPR